MLNLSILSSSLRLSSLLKFETNTPTHEAIAPDPGDKSSYGNRNENPENLPTVKFLPNINRSAIRCVDIYSQHDLVSTVVKRCIETPNEGVP